MELGEIRRCRFDDVCRMTIGGLRSDVKLPKCGLWPPSNTGIRGYTRLLLKKIQLGDEAVRFANES